MDNVSIGEVYFVRFEGIEHEQQGRRPAVVFQNNLGNKHSPNVIVLPMTSARKKKRQPTHVPVSAEESGLPVDSTVLCESPATVSKSRLETYVTTLPAEIMRQIAIGSILSTAAGAFLEPEDVPMVVDLSRRFNSAG